MSRSSLVGENVYFDDDASEIIFVATPDAIEWLDGGIALRFNAFKWLDRFPWLGDRVKTIIGSKVYVPRINNGIFALPAIDRPLSQVAIRMPAFRDPNDERVVILPVAETSGFALPSEFASKPPFFYSSLAAIIDKRISTFNYDYNSGSHFLRYLAHNLGFDDTVPPPPHITWGLRLWAKSLPEPIGVSRETSFHLGYDDCPLPHHIHLSVLNVCNLRCTICWAQNNGKFTPKMMDKDVFDWIAETLFPYAETVEFNSMGEPALHHDLPYFIRRINESGCAYALQTNGTRMSETLLEALSSGIGNVSFSIDATGELFEAQRVNARWSEVEANAKRLLARRNPEKTGVTITVAVTRKTMPDTINLCRWANNAGVDIAYINFYRPIADGAEERPSFAEQAKLRFDLKEFIKKEKPEIGIMAAGEWLNPPAHIPAYTKGLKYSSPRRGYPAPKRMQAGGMEPVFTCPAPSCTCSFTPEGRIFLCCRLYDYTKEIPLTKADFNKFWFEGQPRELRNFMNSGFSLRDKPLPECRDCVAERW